MAASRRGARCPSLRRPTSSAARQFGVAAVQLTAAKKEAEEEAREEELDRRSRPHVLQCIQAH